jgi:serine/threonine-protein kinase RsbW
MTPESHERELLDVRLPGDIGMLPLLSGLIERALRVALHPAPDDEVLHRVDLSLSEAFANTVDHAHSRDPLLLVRVRLLTLGSQVTLEVHDQGPGFDLEEACRHPCDELREHGRGVILIRTLMDQVQYLRAVEPGINVLRMVLSSAGRPSGSEV